MVGFAQKNEVKMIDEYDGLVKDLEPFWALSGEELRRCSEQVGHLPSIDVVRIRDGTSRVENIDAKFNLRIAKVALGPGVSLLRSQSLSTKYIIL